MTAPASPDYSAAAEAARSAAHSAAEAHDFARDARTAAAGIQNWTDKPAGIDAHSRVGEARSAAVRASKLAAEAAEAASGGDAEFAADRAVVAAEMRGHASNLADAAKRSAQEALR